MKAENWIALAGVCLTALTVAGSFVAWWRRPKPPPPKPPRKRKPIGDLLH
jgi:uncharacterized iron-regulated membrane protein